MKDRGFTMLATEVPDGTSEPFPQVQIRPCCDYEFANIGR